MAEMTPLMKQYWEIKSLHQDKVLFFRMGDFYEMFFEDAVLAAPILGIALTSRNKKSQDETPMCGLPHHAVMGPIQKLLSNGLKVAICDQIEDPKFAKGIVKRAVTRVLTPGMVLDSDSLGAETSHYIACAEEQVLACLDVTTGEAFFFAELTDDQIDSLVSRLPIVEWVVENLEMAQNQKKSVQEQVLSPWAGIADQSMLTEQIKGEKAPLRLLSYVQSLSGVSLTLTLKPFERRSLMGRMHLGSSVIRHLEIFETYKGDEQGSFYSSINRTKSSVGARLLKQWISFPLLSESEILKRYEILEKWRGDIGRLKALRDLLGKMGDLERRLSKVGQPAASARDLLAIKDSGRVAFEVLRLSGDLHSQWLPLEELFVNIERVLVEDPPLSVRQGHLIQKGFSEELDAIVLLATDSQSLLEKMEQEERQKTGISSLKIRYNQVFGYYIEVTHTHKDKVPSSYMRKQTLANAERYCTDELVELEKKVLSAQARRNDLEYEIFESLKKKVLETAPLILALASQIAELDVLTSFAWLSMEQRYVRPEFSKNGELFLGSSRHPVVEQSQKSFVPNTIALDSSGCLLLTGPNMAGKSTIMRQVALTALMAQMGLYVAAESARIPLFDQILTRIGASDQLSEGLSTFMVEMTETAQILSKATRKSLVIFDEIGRGTSTFDGMSLAQSILEHLVTRLEALTFFATHYHELTLLDKKYPRLKNAHMSVSEKNGEVRFLHTLKEGPAHKSYGIQVAKLAGIPVEITKRAAEILKKIENTDRDLASRGQLSLFEAVSETSESSSFEPAVEESKTGEIDKILVDIREWPVLKKTPLDAIVQIEKWQNEISSRH